MCFMRCRFENSQGECTRKWVDPLHEKCPHQIAQEEEYKKEKETDGCENAKAAEQR